MTTTYLLAAGIALCAEIIHVNECTVLDALYHGTIETKQYDSIHICHDNVKTECKKAIDHKCIEVGRSFTPEGEIVESGWRTWLLCRTEKVS